MDRNLFRYIWQHSRRDQIAILVVVLLSMPFYFMSLDLPKRIVNDAILGGAFEHGEKTATMLEMSFVLPDFLGGGKVMLFEGLQVDQIGLLVGLSFIFLGYVLINGGFKYVINVAKGALGERMLRRLRFDLFAITLRFTPDTLRTVKPSETATIIKDEVEPIGGFIGDAFVQPILLGAQAITAMTFIMMQSVWLGLVALFVVAIQFTVIPRMRRIQLRLGKQRQLASRLFAGRIGEIMEGMDTIHIHATGRWEQAEIGERLYSLFDLRFRIFKWKFMVKFLNNMLAQITPFFFYIVGGYFALKGQLDIGQLVAVIGAYRDLPPPLKELIDWDQQRLDVTIKYDQIIQQFMPEKLLPADPPISAEALSISLAGPVEIRNLRMLDSHGTPIVDDVSLHWPYPARVALAGEDTSAPQTIALLLARRLIPTNGSITVAGRDLASLPEIVSGRRIAYAGADTHLFPGSLRDNLLYSLRHWPRPADGAAAPNPASGGTLTPVRYKEAIRTGNPIDSPFDDWIDYDIIGAHGPKHLDEQLLSMLAIVNLDEEVYRLGLSGWVDPDRYPALGDRLVEARMRLLESLQSAGLSDLIEIFDEKQYTRLASIGENLLFGASRSPEFIGRQRASNTLLRQVLDEEGLTEDLIRVGATIATTMMEIFEDLDPGHPLVNEFSFLTSEDMAEYKEMLATWSARGLRGLNREGRTMLLAPALDYIEPRHRLGLLDDSLRQRILQARWHLREDISKSNKPCDLEPYEATSLCRNASVRDNLLFGRVNHNMANARERIAKAMIEVVDALELRVPIGVIGLDYDVGPAGRMLTPRQRAGADLVRCLVKTPDMLILDGALSSYPDSETRVIMQRVMDIFENRCLVCVLRNDGDGAEFDHVFHFEGTQLLSTDTPQREGEVATPEAAESSGSQISTPALP